MIQRLRFWHGWKTLRQGTGRAVPIDVRLKCCCCWNLLEKHSAVNPFDEWWPLLSKTLKHDLAGLQHWNNIVWWSIQLLMKPLLRSTTEIVDWLLDTSLSLSFPRSNLHHIDMQWYWHLYIYYIQFTHTNDCDLGSVDPGQAKWASATACYITQLTQSILGRSRNSSSPII